MNARKHRETKLSIWPHQVEGGKYVKILQRFVDSIREEDMEQGHGNQHLFLDDVFIAYLLAFYNSSIRSLRTIEDFSQTVQGQRSLSVRKICKSTLSDFNKLADPKRLEPLLAALRADLARKQPQKTGPKNDLARLLEQAVAVDGTFFPALSNVAWAIQYRNQHSKQKHRARVDTMLDISTGLPETMVVPEPKQGEADAAIEQLKAGKLYLFDRGYNSLPLIAAHYEFPAKRPPKMQSQFVMRLKGESRGTIGLEVVQELSINEADRNAGVVSDRVVRLNSEKSNRLGLQNIELREVIIEYEEAGETKQLRLLTNLFDVPAEVIGQLYRYRWQVELFFRWLKSYGNFRHLISQTKEGLQLNLYVAIIGIMLMYLHTGYRPSKYMFALLEGVAMGNGSLESIMPILKERERQCEVARKSTAKRNAKKKSASQ
ncbi:MAG: IS4 family transposase [Blastopirellula sp.]|nr:MAG: IS4 family transposase [Blastopirellula sp.]